MANSDEPLDEPVVQMLRIVDVIDCVAGNAPDENGRPISILVLAHLGEIEKAMAISYEDSKLLVTKLLQSLSDHGNKYATRILDSYFNGSVPEEEGE